MSSPEIRSMERRLRDLERHVARMDLYSPSGGGGGGRGFAYTEGPVFPAIPVSGIAWFWHTVRTELFVAHQTDTHWYPVREWFAGSGEPGTI